MPMAAKLGNMMRNLEGLLPTHKVTQTFDHVVVRDHETS